MDDHNTDPESSAVATPLYSFILGYDGGNSDEDVMDMSDYDSSSDECPERLEEINGAKVQLQERESPFHPPASLELGTITNNTCVETESSDLYGHSTTLACVNSETAEPSKFIPEDKNRESPTKGFKPVCINDQCTIDSPIVVTCDCVTVPARMPSFTVINKALVSNVIGNSSKMSQSFPDYNSIHLSSANSAQSNVKDSQSVVSSLSLICGIVPSTDTLKMQKTTTETIDSNKIAMEHNNLVTPSTSHNQTDLCYSISSSLSETMVTTVFPKQPLEKDVTTRRLPNESKTNVGPTKNTDRSWVSVSKPNVQNQMKLHLKQTPEVPRSPEQSPNTSPEISESVRYHLGQEPSINTTTTETFQQPLCGFASTRPSEFFRETSCVKKEQIAFKTFNRLKEVCKDVKQLQLHKQCKIIPTTDKNIIYLNSFIWPSHDKNTNSCIQIDARLNSQMQSKSAKYSKPVQIYCDSAPIYKRHNFGYSKDSKDPRVRLYANKSGREHTGNKSQSVTKNNDISSSDRGIFSAPFLSNDLEKFDLSRNSHQRIDKKIQESRVNPIDGIKATVDGETKNTLSSNAPCVDTALAEFHTLHDRTIGKPNSSHTASFKQKSPEISKHSKHKMNGSIVAISPEKKSKDDCRNEFRHKKDNRLYKKSQWYPEKRSLEDSKRKYDLHKSITKTSSKRIRNDDYRKCVAHKNEMKIEDVSRAHNKNERQFKRKCLKVKGNVLDNHLCSRCMLDKTVAFLKPPLLKAKSHACLKCKKKLNPKDLMCKICRQCFPNMMIYTGHVYNSVPPIKGCREFACCQCRQMFASRFLFHTHLAQSGCANLCLICERLFRSRSSMLEHTCVLDKDINNC